MEEEFIFKPSAFKHGILEEDIRNVFHAMKCRKAYLALLKVKGIVE